jgi:transcriptional regulator with XRE-family HTH domain
MALAPDAVLGNSSHVHDDADTVDELRGFVPSDGRGRDREAFERHYMLELGRRIRSAREQRGMTQKQAAEAAGIATDMISRLENGHYQSPGLRTLLRIADGLGTGVGELLPELGTDDHASPVELSQRARLTALTHRAESDDLELIVEIANTIVSRRR